MKLAKIIEIKDKEFIVVIENHLDDQIAPAKKIAEFTNYNDALEFVKTIKYVDKFEV